MRSLWSGNISFGLINIPIHMYSATEEKNIDFDMLRKKDNCPIKYTRVCKNDNEEVPYDQIVKGFEYKEGEYVIVEKEDFENASPKKTHTIEIQQFVFEDEIDSKYFEKPYYLEPAKGADKAYLLLNESLSQSKKVAVAKFVFRNREDLVIIKPDNDLLILNQLRFEHEIKSPDDLKIPSSASVSKDEIKMAIQLVDSLTTKFDAKKYHDTYTDELKKLIEKKAKGEKFEHVKAKEEISSSADLMEQLKASLQHAQR